jgi:hypothetical protein
MGKKAPSAPAAPDPVATANAQAAANKEAVRESALVNQINQVTPMGSLTYSGEIGSPNRTVTQTLSPAQQQMLDLTNQAGIKYGQTANQQLESVAAKLAQPIDFSGADVSRASVEDALFQRLNPQIDRDRSALLTRLANQGIVDPNSEAYRAEMDTFNRGVNDARLAITDRGGVERDRAINELIQQRQIPLNELAAMLTGSQVQAPNFLNTAQYQVNPADIMGATYAGYQGQQNAYAAQQARAGQETAGLYGLLGSGAMAGALLWSDRRLKRDLRRIGTTDNGLGVYRYRYHWDDLEHVGFVAQEVARVAPHAVYTIGGFYAVDYASALRA